MGEFFRKQKESIEEPWETKTGVGSQGITEISRRPGFYALDALRMQEGPFIEVGGFTQGGFLFFDWKEGGEPKETDLYSVKKVHTSNLYPGVPFFPNEGSPFFDGSVDFVADGRSLPFTEESVGSIFISYLGQVSKKGVYELIEAGLEDKVPKVERERSPAKTEAELLSNIAKLRQAVIKEAERVLRYGGYLVWQGGKEEDIAFALQNGFSIKQIERRILGGLHVIFVKDKKE